MILNLVHVNINCTDIRRSVDFYRKLGFEVVHVFSDEPGQAPLDPDADLMAGMTGPDGRRTRGCVLSLGDDPRSTTKIELVEHVDPATQPATPGQLRDAGVSRLALRTKNLLDFVERLKGEGVSFLAEPVEIDIVSARRFALFRDPDGVILELIEF